MWRNILIFLAVAGTAWFFWSRLRRPNRLFEIRIGENDVTILGPIPNRGPDAVRDFIHTLKLPVGSRIRGIEDGPGFRLAFSSSIRRTDRDKVYAYLRGIDSPKILH